jgi:hypothetical protein
MPLCCIVYDEERKPHSALSPYRFGVGWLFSSVLFNGSVWRYWEQGNEGDNQVRAFSVCANMKTKRPDLADLQA